MAFNCVIVTPEQQMFDQQVSQVIFPAFDGKVGILTDRAPMLAKLGVGELRLTIPGGPGGGTEHRFFVDGGIAQMKDNKLTILTNAATTADQLDAETARAELAEASARRITDDKSFTDRQHAIAGARAKVEMAGKR